MKTPALFTDTIDLKYFTGVSQLNGFLLLAGKEKIIMTFDAESASESTGFKVIRFRKDTVKEFGELLKKKNIRKVHSPVKKMSFENYGKLSKIVKLVDNTGELNETRAVKNKKEIIALKKASNYAAEAMKAARDAIRVGVTEKKVRAEALNAVTPYCEDAAFPFIIASGVNSMRTHGYPTGKKIREGETIIVDLGLTYDGYHSDMTRTFSINPTEKQSDLYENVLGAYNLAFGKARPGVTAGFLAGEVNKFFEKKKVKQYWKYSLGHGVGLEIHECPFLRLDGKEKLKKNMAFTIEPGLHAPGVGGCRVEDTVLLGKKPVKLTKFGYELRL